MLLLVALPLLCFLVITAALCMAHLTETRERKRRRVRARLIAAPPAPPKSARPQRAAAFAAISILDAFEPDTAVLWETQIPALQLLADAGPEGLDAEALNPFYARSAAGYPELYDGTSFHTWLEFLQASELLAATGNRIVITPIGTEFLKCRVPVHARV